LRTDFASQRHPSVRDNAGKSEYDYRSSVRDKASFGFLSSRLA